MNFKYRIPLGQKIKNRTLEICQENYPRIKNWRNPTAALDDAIKPIGGYFTHNCGRYSSRCQYTKYEYSPYCQSFGEIIDNGSALVGKIGVENFHLIAPKGFIFAADNLGVSLQSKSNPKKNFYFNSDDVLFNGVKGMLFNLRENWEKQKNARKLELEKQYHQKIFEREINSTRVNLQDSRCAGNCIEGTLNWVKQRLGIDRDTIMDGSYLFSVPAKKLLPLANDDARVKKSINMAWMRETLVSI